MAVDFERIFFLFTFYSIKFSAYITGNIVVFGCGWFALLSQLLFLLKLSAHCWNMTGFYISTTRNPHQNYGGLFSLIFHSYGIIECLAVLARAWAMKRVLQDMDILLKEKNGPMNKSYFLSWLLIIITLRKMNLRTSSVGMFTNIQDAARSTFHDIRNFEQLTNRCFMVSIWYLYERSLHSIVADFKAGNHLRALQRYHKLVDQFQHMVDAFRWQLLNMMVFDIVYLVRMITGHLWDNITKFSMCYFLSIHQATPLLIQITPGIIRAAWIFIAPQYIQWQRKRLLEALLKEKLKQTINSKKEGNAERRMHILLNGNESRYDIYRIWIEQVIRNNLDIRAGKLMTLNFSLLCTEFEVIFSYVVVAIGFVV